MKSIICVAEDRQLCEPCLKLLLLSLNAHSPEAGISLFYPCATESFLQWIGRFPQLRLETRALKRNYGWNIKPQAILRMIEQGYDEVIWIDSDIIICRDVRPVFAPLKRDVIVATEDALGDERKDGNALRARLWGLKVGRVLPFGLNTGVLRVTKDHCDLLERWWGLLQSTVYQDVQRREWQQRPLHMLGDQDVLTALLTSDEFSDVPIHILRRGQHIIQFNGVYGYTLAERIRTFLHSDSPVFIHSFGGKPWSEQWLLRSHDLKEFIKKLYLDLSPYTLSAMRFSGELECDVDWMQPHHILSRILRTFGFGCPELVGLPIAASMDLVRIIKWLERHLSAFLFDAKRESATDAIDTSAQYTSDRVSRS